MRRYALRDEQWERIENLLPGRPGHVGVTARDNRLFVEAVLYRYWSGIPWRDLPDRVVAAGRTAEVHLSGRGVLRRDERGEPGREGEADESEDPDQLDPCAQRPHDVLEPHSRNSLRSWAGPSRAASRS